MTVFLQLMETLRWNSPDSSMQYKHRDHFKNCKLQRLQISAMERLRKVSGFGFGDHSNVIFVYIIRKVQ